ncbi:MAG: O-methyltransferase [Erysipelotrichaceae bacterium]|nr:O-methyltransferase [Erysipelotrichaceae bacterium]
MVELTDIEIDALKRNIPIMQKEGLIFMIDKLNEIHATSCLEIGSAIGYSAMMMCLNVKDLKIDTIEINQDQYNEALHHIDHYQLTKRISIHLGDALTLDTNELLYKPYDCLFIDAAKAQYQKFFEKYISYVNDKGIVIVDNLDFHGMIYDIDHIKNRNTKQLVKKIKRFKDWIFNNEDYDATYYHIGDGICIITRKEKHETCHITQQ